MDFHLQLGILPRALLESGLVTTRSVSTIAAKNIGKFAIVSVVFYLVGYNLGYGIPEEAIPMLTGIPVYCKITFLI